MAGGVWKMLNGPKLYCLVQTLKVRAAQGREGLRVHAGLVDVAGKWNHTCLGRRWCHGELHLSSSLGRREVRQCSLPFPGAPASPSIHPSLLLCPSVPPSLCSFLPPSLPPSLFFPLLSSIPLSMPPPFHPSASLIPTTSLGKVGGEGLFLGASPWQRLPPPSVVAFP